MQHCRNRINVSIHKKTHFTSNDMYTERTNNIHSTMAVYIYSLNAIPTQYIPNVSILQKSGISFSALSANRLKWN